MHVVHRAPAHSGHRMSVPCGTQRWRARVRRTSPLASHGIGQLHAGQNLAHARSPLRGRNRTGRGNHRMAGIHPTQSLSGVVMNGSFGPGSSHPIGPLEPVAYAYTCHAEVAAVIMLLSKKAERSCASGNVRVGRDLIADGVYGG